MSRRTVDDAASQLRRLLIAIPALADDSPHRIADIADLVGVSEDTLTRDLFTLVTRFDDGPGGFVEGVRLAFSSDTVQLESHLFRRPMGLTPAELVAIELGLAALAQELPPHEAAVAERARERVAAASTVADFESDRRAVHAASGITSDKDSLHLSVLRTAIATRMKAAIQYRSASSPDGAARTVHPYGLVYARGRWFLIGYCDKASSIRIFRLDRMMSAVVLNSPADIPDHLDVEGALRDGRAMVGHSEEVLCVSYSPRIARWIAEHTEVEAQLDGSVIGEHPLLDDEWAVRHVLQYGPDAQVLEPERIRQMVLDRLRIVSAS